MVEASRVGGALRQSQLQGKFQRKVIGSAARLVDDNVIERTEKPACARRQKTGDKSEHTNVGANADNDERRYRPAR